MLEPVEYVKSRLREANPAPGYLRVRVYPPCHTPKSAGDWQAETAVTSPEELAQWLQGQYAHPRAFLVLDYWSHRSHHWVSVSRGARQGRVEELARRAFGSARMYGDLPA